ncbi:MAG: hypothetical protein JEZ14_07375 [Marinilabiliaceae bacterium]|nr:hypothetical protein [Marinilabiliaceae bacterium]
MARQKGIIKLEGRIGDLSFYKNGGEYMARSKSGVDGDRIKKDPAFIRTRENGAEFGSAGKAGKVLRNALKVPISKSADKQVAGRLGAELLKVIQADTTNLRGERTVTAGDLNLLKGFEFNKAVGLESVVTLPYTLVFTRSSGDAVVNIPAFVPKSEIAQVEGATHFRLVAGVAAVDFANQSYEVDVAESADLVYDANTQPSAPILLNISADSPHPVFMVFGVEYYQSVNGQMYPLNNKASNPLALVLVDVV